MIPLFKPAVGKEELREIARAFKAGWIGLGPKTAQFERMFADYIGTRYAIGMNSCSAALHLALAVLGIEGKEVISPSLTFVSTNHAILYNKGIPVFADIDEDTLNINPEEIARKITRRTKAIILVHYGGHPCQMDEIMHIAKKRGIAVIEDAAHACGAEYKGRKAGTFGALACFSFHAVKNLTTGEGGMVTTSSREFDRRLRKLRWLGISRDTWSRSDTKGRKYFWYYYVEELGYKYHMSDINASIGIAQLRKLDRMNDKRRMVLQRYNRDFSGLGWLKTPVLREGVKSACHNYVVKVKERDRFVAYLRNHGVSAGVHYIPNHHYRMYRKFKAGLPVTDRVWKELVTLPLFAELTGAQVDKVIKTVKSFK